MTKMENEKLKTHLMAMRDNILEAVQDFSQNNDRKAMYVLGYTLRCFDEYLGKLKESLPIDDKKERI